MILPSISDYILAIGSGRAGFDKLCGIEFAADAHGRPVYDTTSRFVEFEARLHGQRCRLCCPTDGSYDARAERLSNALKRIDSPRLAAYRLLRDEMRIGTLSGAGRLCDVVVEMMPEGDMLGRILEKRLTAAAARRLAAEWIDTAEELGRIGFSHRALSPSKIIVRSDGGITLRGLHHGRIETSADDHFAIADITLRILRNAVPAADAPSAAEIAAAAGDRNELCRMLRGIAAARKRSGTRGVMHHTACRRLLGGVDFSNRESIGIFCEDRVVFRENGLYGYLDMYNNVAIAPQFLFADAFREGRATVETDSGQGLIDKRGRWIIEPRFREVSWSERYNIAQVRSDEGWAVYDSLGHRLTGYYDYLGDCRRRRMAALREGRWGYLDTAGNEVVPLRFDDAFGYDDDGIATVRLDGRLVRIDLSGSEIA